MKQSKNTVSVNRCACVFIQLSIQTSVRATNSYVDADIPNTNIQTRRHTGRKTYLRMRFGYQNNVGEE